MDAGWTTLATQLQLNDTVGDKDGMGVKRTYLLWLWMQTAWNETFSVGQGYQNGLIGSISANAFEERMATMNIEFPMLTIAQTMKYNYTESGLDCADFYTTKLGVADSIAQNLCQQSTNFTFADPMLTCVALTNTYLYLGEFNMWYYDEFMDVTDISSLSVVDFFYRDTESTFTAYYDALQQDLKYWLD